MAGIYDFTMRTIDGKEQKTAPTAPEVRQAIEQALGA